MRTISEVIDHENETSIKAEDFFDQGVDAIFKKRYELERAFQLHKKSWVCPVCRQPIKIRGRRDGIISMHFAHVADRLDCPIKTGRDYTKDQILRMKYNGQKESPRHYKLKTLIADKISNDSRFTEIKTDNRFGGICKDWRKPDVSAIFNGKKVVFELQLSTTFLSVIVERNLFYQNNETYILWIFDNKTQNVDDMRFMEKDIFYPNNHNAFFIDENIFGNHFKLICGYERSAIDGDSIRNHWQVEEVDFDKLTFGADFQVYWFDYETNRRSLQQELDKRQLLEFEKLWEQLRSEEDRKSIFEKYSHFFDGQSADFKFYELSGLLDCLYSIKLKRVIGSNYQKVIQVLHQYFQKEINRESHFGDYIFKAIGTFGFRSLVFREDKTGKFVARAKAYKRDQFELSHKYDSILKLLFPELW